MISISVSDRIYKKLERLRPKGRTMNLVIHALLKEAKITKEKVEDTSI